uniref:Uncharacterized protein n=1 Tax=Lepeophtheirus salmonis TaxID=72036 RepID=A0A0K2T6A0_LEPSM
MLYFIRVLETCFSFIFRVQNSTRNRKMVTKKRVGSHIESQNIHKIAS